ncbi:MAG: ABC transporter permease [Betaproteobacteria bacterium]|nr:ABC transporter permease [Betaproteobacteria bacterium]
MSTAQYGRIAATPAADDMALPAWRRLATDAVYIAIPVAIVLVCWQLFAKLSGVPAALFPPVEAVGSALYAMAAEGTLWSDIGGTFARLLKAVVVGAVVGTVLGALMGNFRHWERLFVVPLNFLLAVPGTALFPLTMLWFGISEMAILSILIYEVTLTVMANTWTGVKSIDVSLIRAGRAFGATGASMFWRVLMPSAMPSIISGYRLAFSRAWRILIIAEMLISVGSGLGYRLYWAREFFHTDVVYAGLFTVGIVGLVFERLVLRTAEVMTVNRWGTVRELE